MLPPVIHAMRQVYACEPLRWYERIMLLRLLRWFLERIRPALAISINPF